MQTLRDISKPTLVLGGTGKTGRRVAERLTARGLAVRIGSRSGAPPFDWEDRVDLGARARRRPAPSTSATTPTSRSRARSRRPARSPSWPCAGRAPDRAPLGPRRARGRARRGGGARHGRRADDPALDLVHAELQRGLHARPRASGEIRLPAGDVPTPFLDIDDLADVAVAALTADRHPGRLYELTGPHSLTFADTAAVIAAASGREVRYVPVPHRGARRASSSARRPARGRGAPDVPLRRDPRRPQREHDEGVEHALGRATRDFAGFARTAAAAAAWNVD